MTVKKVRKLVNIWWSYKAYKVCQIFWATLYRLHLFYPCRSFSHCNCCWRHILRHA